METSDAREVVGRFAPSPSGHMHLGNALSCLVAWLACRSADGRMVLRIEDLDTRCQNPALARDVIDDLRWLGLDWDEEPVYQSDRADAYDEAIAKLKQLGLVYPCFCTRSELHAASAPHASDGTYIYVGTCRDLTPEQVAEKTAVREPALRIRVPGVDDPTGHVSFVDATFGPQDETLATQCGDILIRRSDGVIAYQLAVSVDDGSMGITQVVRGHDLLGSCARQMWLMRTLGYEPPSYLHVPLLMAPDGRRLSKRDGDLELRAIRAAGMSPKRVVGRLAAACGLIDSPCDMSARELLEHVAGGQLHLSRGDYVVDESFLL